MNQITQILISPNIPLYLGKNWVLVLVKGRELILSSVFQTSEAM